MNNWSKLDLKVRNSASYLSFKNALINFVRPSDNKIFNIHDKVGVKLLMRLRLGFSHLRELADTLNPPCPCSIEAETFFSALPFL